MSERTAPTVSRPGRSLFVPEVRLSKLGRTAKGREPATVMEDVHFDIVGVEVTRVNTGAGQFAITLNNWHDTLPHDRRNGDQAAGRSEPRRDGTPLLPRFKYNDFQRLGFGDRLRIDMRYWPPDPAIGATDTAQDAGWVPMISGAVTDMRFTFSANDGARLVVSGEEDLTPLKARNPKRVPYRGKSERDIVRDVLARAGYAVPLARSPLPWPPFAEDDARALSEEHPEGQSYLEYLQKFADRMDFEVFVEFADLAAPNGGIEFHFEPARSAVPPDAALRDVFVLERGRLLLDFTPTLKVVDQHTSVVVQGKHRVRGRPARVRRTALPEILSDELPFDAARPGPRPTSGPEWRQRLYPPLPGETESNRNVVSNQTNLDDERAQTLAEAMLRKKAREFLTIQATTVGLPLLRPGRYVEIHGVRPPFDGFYYVTQTVHSFGESGLGTRVTARRPGMPFPPYGEV